MCSGCFRLLEFVVLLCRLVSIGFKWCQIVLIGVRLSWAVQVASVFRVVVGCFSLFQFVQVVQLVLGQLGYSDCIWLSWFVMFCFLKLSQLCYVVLGVFFMCVC